MHRQTRAFTPMLKFPVHLTCMSLDYGRKAEHTKSDNKLTYKLNLDSKSKPALKIAPSRRKAKKDLPFKHGHKYKNTHTHHPFASTGALYTKTSSQFLCLLHTALAPTEQHVKTVIFRHTSPAVCWLFPWCRGDSEQGSGEQGARLASSPASLRLLMQQQPAWPPG